MKKFFTILLLLPLLFVSLVLTSCAKHSDELMKYVNKTELTLTELENLEFTGTSEELTVFIIIHANETYLRYTHGDDTYQEWVRESDGVYFKYTKEGNLPLKTEALENTSYILTKDTAAKAGKKYYKVDVENGGYVETEFEVGVYEEYKYTFEIFRTDLLKSLELKKTDLPASESEIKDGGTPNSIEYSHDGCTYLLNLTKWKSLSTGVDGYHVKEWTKTDENGKVTFCSYRYPWSFTSTEIPEIK